MKIVLAAVVAVAFDRAEEGVSPGQACELSDRADAERILGGGFIDRTAAFN